ncbi:MAG: hypothetical protein Q9165_001114 [Trypethelium subeluteriae]
MAPQTSLSLSKAPPSKLDQKSSTYSQTPKLNENFTADPRPLVPAYKHAPHVLVIGAGVAGCTTAWLLLDKGYRVTILASALPSFEPPEHPSKLSKDTKYSFKGDERHQQQRLTSQIGGALWEFPSPPCGPQMQPENLERARRWALESYQIYMELAARDENLIGETAKWESRKDGVKGLKGDDEKVMKKGIDEGDAKEMKTKDDVKDVKKGDYKYELKETKDFRDAKSLKDLKDVGDVKDLKDVKDVKDIKDAKDANDAKYLKGIEDVKDIKDIEATKDIKDAKDLKDLKDIKKFKDISDVYDSKDDMDIKDVEDIKGIVKEMEIKGGDGKKTKKVEADDAGVPTFGVKIRRSIALYPFQAENYAPERERLRAMEAKAAKSGISAKKGAEEGILQGFRRDYKGDLVREFTYPFATDSTPTKNKMNESKAKASKKDTKPGERIVDATEHLAPVIDTDRAMAFLLSLLVSKGANFVNETIHGDLRDQEAELLRRSGADVVVNASGLGARTLASDENVIAAQGGLIRVRNDGTRFPKMESAVVVNSIWQGDHDIVFLVPRNEDVLVIGTFFLEDQNERDDREAQAKQKKLDWKDDNGKKSKPYFKTKKDDDGGKVKLDLKIRKDDDEGMKMELDLQIQTDEEEDWKKKLELKTKESEDLKWKDLGKKSKKDYEDEWEKKLDLKNKEEKKKGEWEEKLDSKTKKDDPREWKKKSSSDYEKQNTDEGGLLDFSSPHVQAMIARAERAWPPLRNAQLDEAYPLAQAWRPFRKGDVRVEREQGLGKKKSRIVHAYGHGVYGWTVAFGSAAEVVRLVGTVVEEMKGEVKDVEVKAKL